LDFPDNRFDEVALIDLAKAIEDKIAKFQPTTVYTHNRTDLNVDHELLCRAVLIATRPQPGQVVREVFAFEVMSSTEWSYPTTFSPDTFVNIEPYIDDKLDAMAMYTSELRESPHPRSLESIRAFAAVWGSKCGCRYAEAFCTLRRILV
jgi:LmbE family N-acetylglucosaminyl deacetylase